MQLGHNEASRSICQDTPGGRTPARGPHVQLNTAPRQPGIGALASDVRAFPGLPESAHEARAFVGEALAGLPAAADAALMTSELFANAINYTASGLPGGIVVVGVRRTPACVCVDVVNAGELPPCITRYGHGLGKGLEIVRQLASAFGVNGRDWWFIVFTGGEQ